MGIDPGKRGGIAVLDGERVEVYDMPDLKGFIKVVKLEKPDLVVVEKQGVVKGNGVIAIRELMKHYGELIGVLEALGIDYLEVLPRVWRKLYWGKRKFKSHRERKLASLELAKKFFPEEEYGIKIGKKDGRAEALLIALYGLSKVNEGVGFSVKVNEVTVRTSTT